jgi:RHS repeat-associated protein
VDIPNGQHTTFGYYDNLGDHALANITHLTSSGAIISKFDYGYSAPGRIGDWTQQQGAQTPVKTSFGYDDVDQLRDATARDTATQAVVKRYAYHYDPAGNRTTEQVDNMVATESPNDLNQLTGRTAGGAMKVQGALTEPASVTINGVPARVDANNQFEGSAAVKSGMNQFEVAATDGNGNTATQRYQVNVPAAASVTQEYDFNGNLTRKTEGTAATTYEWDAANRLTAINVNTQRSEFEYDGLSRRVHIVEKESGMVISNKRFIWTGLQLAEERDEGGNTVTKRYCRDGMQVPGTGNYYYSKDQLGSIRELTDGDGAVRARYAYDPYGTRAKKSGDIDSDFGFTGHYVHQPSRLLMAPYRVYDCAAARWISRDPLAERGGLNLYGYVGNSPVSRADPTGLWYAMIPGTWFDGNGAEGWGANFFRGDDFNDGAYAALDAMNPFGNPFANNGYIKDCADLEFSRDAGRVAAAALSVAGFAGAWGALGGPTIGLGWDAISGHAFWGVTQGAETTMMHGLTVTTTQFAEGWALAAPGTYSITGIPVFFPAAALASRVPCWNCVTAALGAVRRGLIGF